MTALLPTESTPVPAAVTGPPLHGRRLVVTGVLTTASIAFEVARQAQDAGAEVVLTAPGRTASLTGRIARRLPQEAPVVPLDVTDEGDLDALRGRLAEVGMSEVDGVLHAIGFAPPSCLGGGFLDTPWEDVATALRVSTYSFVALTRALLPALRPGSSVLGLDFDASRAWPSYDWMGVAKAGLESATRYLARDLGPKGVRVNLVAAGPLRTTAARGGPGLVDLADSWSERAPLGWDADDASGVATTCLALLSPWMPTTTGQVIHADGGASALGM